MSPLDVPLKPDNRGTIKFPITLPLEIYVKIPENDRNLDLRWSIRFCRKTYKWFLFPPGWFYLRKTFSLWMKWQKLSFNTNFSRGVTFLSTHATDRPATRLATSLCSFMSSLRRSSNRPLRNLKSLSVYVALPAWNDKNNYMKLTSIYFTIISRASFIKPFHTWEGIISVKDVNFLPAITIYVTCCHSDGIAVSISECIIWRTAVVNCNV